VPDICTGKTSHDIMTLLAAFFTKYPVKLEGDEVGDGGRFVKVEENAGVDVGFMM
jgi:hypothetical protein